MRASMTYGHPAGSMVLGFGDNKIFSDFSQINETLIVQGR